MLESYGPADVGGGPFGRLGRPKPIIAGVASIPERVQTLKIAVESIYWQVDRLVVYLNNYGTVPEFLEDPKITVARSEDHGDVKDVGKFHALKSTSDGILFTIDDDIRYPPNYVSSLLDALEALNYQAVVGVHGIILPRNPKSFFDRKAFPFKRKLEAAIPVSMLGTGTCAFDIRRVGIPLSVFTSYGMADIHLGIYLKQKGIPAVSVPRPDGWLEDLSGEDDVLSLYGDTRKDPSAHTLLIRKERPWGEEDILARSRSIVASSLFSDKIKFALEIIARVRAQAADRDLFKLPEGLSLERPVLDAVKWLEVFSDPATREKLYSRALEERKTRRLREVCLAGLWRLNARSCIERSRRIALSEPEDAEYLFLHAKYCDQYGLLDEAGSYFREAARKAAGSPQQGLWERILFDWFGFCVANGQEATAKSLSWSISKQLGDHPLYHSGMFLVELAVGDTASARQHLLDFLHLSNDGSTTSQRNIKRLMISLITRRTMDWAPDREWLTISCMDSYADRFSELSMLLRIALLLKDLVSAQACWSRMLLYHREHLDHHPEWSWYYFSQFDAGEGLRALTCGRDDTGRGWLARPPFEFFSRIASMDHGAPSACDAQPRITVVMTAFNAEQTIGYAVRSITNQTHGNLELIVVDDVSTDGTVAIVEELARRDPRIRLLGNRENVGPYRSRNAALEVATGEFVAIQDADDAALPDRLERQLSAFSEQAVAVLGTHVRLDREGRVQLENDGSIIGHGPVTLMFRRQILEEIGNFAEVRTRGDKEFESRIEHFYGAHALLRLDDLMVCCLDAPNTNSHNFSRGAEQRRNLMLFKQDYARRHAAGDFSPPAQEQLSAPECGGRMAQDQPLAI